MKNKIIIISTAILTSFLGAYMINYYLESTRSEFSGIGDLIIIVLWQIYFFVFTIIGIIIIIARKNNIVFKALLVSAIIFILSIFGSYKASIIHNERREQERIERNRLLEEERLKFESDFKKDSLNPILLYKKGLEEENNYNTELAIKYFNKSIEQDSSNIDVYEELLSIYTIYKDTDNVIIICKKLLKFNDLSNNDRNNFEYKLKSWRKELSNDSLKIKINL